MIYQVHTRVNRGQLEDLLNTLASVGWRLHSVVPSGYQEQIITVIMQIEPKEVRT